MNFWTERSCEFAQQRNYLDELYKVYPVSPNLKRELPADIEDNIRFTIDVKDNELLIKQLLDLEVFPIKDSFVSFLKRDRSAVSRNPATIDRLAGILYEMGADQVIQRCTRPKEANRQIGPMFKQWIKKKTLGVDVLENDVAFLESGRNCILCMSDSKMQEFAKKYLGYERDKGIDFLAKFNNKYVIAEAKFITDFGGHQDAQFDDAISTIRGFTGKRAVDEEVLPISIMDGVLYIRGRNKLYKFLENNPDLTVISSLLLRDYLYTL